MGEHCMRDPGPIAGGCMGAGCCDCECFICEGNIPPPATPPKPAAPVCSTCNDTHRMPFGEDYADVMCTRCPLPCRACASNGGRGPYCTATPCGCACHRNAPEPDEAERVAREFWRWFRSAPHAECSDHQCDVRLAALLRDAERRGYERGVEDSAREAERNIIEYAEIDVLDTTPERLRIARRIRALASRGPR